MSKNYYMDLNSDKVILLDDTLYNKDEYVLLRANTTNGAVEKHVPIYEVDGNDIVVNVGSVEHPMNGEHYVMWISQIDGDKVVTKELKPGELPKARFEYIRGSSIYAYCNLHGLWKCIVE